MQRRAFIAAAVGAAAIVPPLGHHVGRVPDALEDSVDQDVDHDFMSLVGRNVQRLRESKGLLRCDLARLCDTDAITIVQIERGADPLEGALFLRLAKALDVTAEELSTDKAGVA